MRVAVAVVSIALCVLPSVRAEAGGLPPAKTSTLSAARLPAAVRKRIERTIFDGESMDSYTREDFEETTELVRVRLGRNGQAGLRVRSGYPMCGATGNCTWWIFDPSTGFVLLKEGLGYQFRFLATQHGDLYDVKITQNLSCCDGVNHIYQFDGKEYRDVRTQPYSVKR